jgi:hypothetical protein
MQAELASNRNRRWEDLPSVGSQPLLNDTKD